MSQASSIPQSRKNTTRSRTLNATPYALVADINFPFTSDEHENLLKSRDRLQPFLIPGSFWSSASKESVRYSTKLWHRTTRYSFCESTTLPLPKTN